LENTAATFYFWDKFCVASTSSFDTLLTLAGLLNDLFVLDLDQLEWTDLTGMVIGTPPAPRAGLGITSVSGRFFIFGGVFPDSGLATPFIYSLSCSVD
jgi:hypothetical protein